MVGGLIPGGGGNVRRVERRLGVVPVEERTHLAEIHEKVGTLEPHGVRRALQPCRALRVVVVARGDKRAVVQQTILRRRKGTGGGASGAVAGPEVVARRVALRGRFIVGRHRSRHETRHLLEDGEFVPDELHGRGARGNLKRDILEGASWPVPGSRRQTVRRASFQARELVAVQSAGVGPRAVRPTAVRVRLGGGPRARGVGVQEILLSLGATARARASRRRERLGFALGPNNRRVARLRRRGDGDGDGEDLLDAIPGDVSRLPGDSNASFLDGGARAVRRLLGEGGATRGASALARRELAAESNYGIRKGAELVRLLAVVAPSHERVARVDGDAAGHAPVRRAHHHQTLRAIQHVGGAALGGARARRRSLAPPAEGRRARADGRASPRDAGRLQRDPLVLAAVRVLGRDARAGGLVRSRGS
mmetsp:Transcript_15134/g.64782  ORF Transcript_15134/g.64782 Transcript_15134/m.64782 type:complete len:422 (+) Transcript_15134:3284-4549(+)